MLLRYLKNKMANKNQNTILWILGIAILLLLVVTQTNLFQTQETEDFSIKVHYYDINGDEIYPDAKISGEDTLSYFNFFKNIFSSSTLPLVGASVIDEEHLNEENNYEPNFLEKLIRNLIPATANDEIELDSDEIGEIREKKDIPFNIFDLFSIVTTTKTITLPITYARTYTYRECDDDYDDYDSNYNSLDPLGADQKSNVDHGDCRVVGNAIMRFSTTSLPSDLTSSSQITSVKLTYRIDNVVDDDNGASTDFAVITSLSSNLPGTSTMWEDLEYVSGLAGFTHNMLESQEEQTFTSINLPNAASEIMERDSLDIGIEGESNSIGGDDEYGDLYSIGESYAPYITIKYNVQTCVPETCSSLGYECGTWDDTCGGQLNCGTCGDGYACSDGQCVEDISYISFDITATNTGNVDITQARIVSATPIEFLNSLNINDLRSINKGQSTTWNSGLIEVKPEWKGVTTSFEVSIEGASSYEEIQKYTKSTTIEVDL